MTMILRKKNIFFSIILTACMFSFSLINTYLFHGDLPNTIWAIILTSYFFIFPSALGVMLKVFINNGNSAVLITLLSMTVSCIGTAIICNENFFIQLLIRLINIPVIMFYYFVTFLFFDKQKKAVSLLISIISTFITTLLFFGGNLLFLELVNKRI